MLFLVILDLFFPSDWSKKKYPHLNTRTQSNNPTLFVFLSVFLVALYNMCYFVIIFSGKHTIAQGINGTIIGAWCGCFFHFVMRDTLFKHTTRLTHKVGELSGKQALLHCLYATLVTMGNVATKCILAWIGMKTMVYDQGWRENMRGLCGTKFAADENGLLLGFDREYFRFTMVTSADCVTYLGLYVG